MTELDAGAKLMALSKWVDAGNAQRSPEALLWHRVGKIAEEYGEAIEALIGALGGNPRKGFTHQTSDVVQELLDVAVTALGAVEHMTGYTGEALTLLTEKIDRVHARALGDAVEREQLEDHRGNG